MNRTCSRLGNGFEPNEPSYHGKTCAREKHTRRLYTLSWLSCPRNCKTEDLIVQVQVCGVESRVIDQARLRFKAIRGTKKGHFAWIRSET